MISHTPLTIHSKLSSSFFAESLDQPLLHGVFVGCRFHYGARTGVRPPKAILDLREKPHDQLEELISSSNRRDVFVLEVTELGRCPSRRFRFSLDLVAGQSCPVGDVAKFRVFRELPDGEVCIFAATLEEDVEKRISRPLGMISDARRIDVFVEDVICLSNVAPREAKDLDEIRDGKVDQRSRDEPARPKSEPMRTSTVSSRRDSSVASISFRRFGVASSSPRKNKVPNPTRTTFGRYTDGTASPTCHRAQSANFFLSASLSSARHKTLNTDP